MDLLSALQKAPVNNPPFSLIWTRVRPTADETDLIESTLKSSLIQRSLLRVFTFSSADEIL
jgi:hypothetical protein